LVFHSTEPQDNVVGKAYINAAFAGRKLGSDRWEIASSAEIGDVSERVAVRNTKSRVGEGLMRTQRCGRKSDEIEVENFAVTH
jgi:hypothetical protein